MLIDSIASCEKILEEGYLRSNDVSAINLSEEDKQRARALAEELKEKIERYFPEPLQAERVAEIRSLRALLEKMGFLVQWKASLNTETMQCTAEVTLYLPRASATILAFSKPTSP